MTQLTQSPTGIVEALGALEGDFPFEIRLSLDPLIRFWAEVARGDSIRAELARTLLERVREAPELRGAIEDPASLDRHRSVVDALMSAVFPAAFLEQSHSAALIPFKLRSIYGSQAFAQTLMDPHGVVQGQLNLDVRSLKSF